MLIAANIAIVVLALLIVPLAIRSRLQRWVACAFVSGAVETLAKLWISPFLRAQPRPLHGAGFAVFLLERFMLLGVDVVVVAALIAIYGMARQRWWRASIWAGAAVWLVMATTYVHGAGPGPYRIAGFAFGPKYLFLAAAIVNAAVSSAAMVFGLRPALARARSNADFAAVVSMTAFSAGVTLRLALPAVPGLTIGWEYVAAFLMAVYITVGGVQTAALAAGPLKAISPTIQRSLQRLRRELALSEMARALGRTRARLDSIATPWAARYVALHRLGGDARSARSRGSRGDHRIDAARGLRDRDAGGRARRVRDVGSVSLGEWRERTRCVSCAVRGRVSGGVRRARSARCDARGASRRARGRVDAGGDDGVVRRARHVELNSRPVDGIVAAAIPCP